MAAAISAADPQTLADAPRGAGTADAGLPGGQVTIEMEHVLLTEAPRSGWVVESRQGVTIVLDTAPTPEPEAEGLARDVVRLVQQACKDAGFDRIALTGGDEVEVRVSKA